MEEGNTFLKFFSFLFRQGFLGLEALLNYFVRVWLQDIKKNQLPSILSGVGPMNAFVQLCKFS